MSSETLRAAREVRTGLRGKAAEEWLRSVARPGLAARAVIYVVLGLLAAMIVADGRPPAQASGSGALAEIARQPAGPFLLGLLSAGLLCYAAWRLAQGIAGVDPAEPGRPGVWRRAGWLATAGVYLLLFADALSLLVGAGASGGAATHPQGAAATVLTWPGGTVVLGAAGAALAAGAVGLGTWGCLHDYGRVLDTARAPSWAQAASRVSGTVGNLARACLLALVASYTLLAAVDDAPSREKSLDQSLEAVLHSPAGPWWIALAAAGLVSFAAYSAIEACYRRV